MRTSDALLARRARYGDPRALHRLARRHRDRITLLATVVGTNSEQSALLAREVVAPALQTRRPLDDALVMAFGRLAKQASDPDAARGRLLVQLVDLELQPAAVVADLLGLSHPDALQLLAKARSAGASTYPGWECRGWGLVSHRSGLSQAEQQAGDGHLTLCRRCRHRLAAVEKARRDLLVRTTGVAGLLAAGELAAAASAPAAVGLSGLLAGKAAIGVVGVLGATVLATGGVVAVAEQPHRARPAPVTSVSPAARPTAQPAVPQAKPALPSTPQPTTSATQPPALQLPVLRSTPLPLPTAIPLLPLPTLKLPQLPLPLPSLPLIRLGSS